MPDQSLFPGVRHGVPEPDPLIMDERFAAAFVTGRGLTVLSACSHAGIVNARALLLAGPAKVVVATADGQVICFG